MSKKRQQYSSEFKAKVALAVVRGDETVPQLATSVWFASDSGECLEAAIDITGQ